MLSSSRPRLLLSTLACLFLFAGPASAYIVILKNGSQITTTKKYEVRGEKVLLTLSNGTTASYRAAEIDFAKTDEVNRYGTLNNSTVLEAQEEKAEPTKPDEERAFGDLISNRSLALPPQNRKTSGQRSDDAKTGGNTKAGFVNLTALPRRPFSDAELSSEIMTYLRGQGVDEVRIYQGSKAKRALVEVVAASEASVFKVMKDAANCVVQLEQRYPKKLESLELYMTTDGKTPAGQFTLNAELANQLASGRVEPATFFVRYVEF